MQPTTLKKILIVLTNTTRYGEAPEPTGLWLGEATEFALIMQKVGYQVDYVSPKGGIRSIGPTEYEVC